MVEINWGDVGKFTAGSILGCFGVSLLEFFETFASGITEDKTGYGEIVAGGSAAGNAALGVSSIDLGLKDEDVFKKGIELGGGLASFSASVTMAGLAVLLSIGGKREVEKRMEDLQKAVGLK